MTFEFGHVVLVPFPFSDQSATKKRPAVVISSARYQLERQDLLVLAVTSQLQLVGSVVVAITGFSTDGFSSP